MKIPVGVIVLYFVKDVTNTITKMLLSMIKFLSASLFSIPPQSLLVSAEAYKSKPSCIMRKTLKQVQMSLLSISIQYGDSESAILDALAKRPRNTAGANYGIT